MTRHELVFRAGLTRFLMGTAALVLLPSLFPAWRGFWWVFALYLGFSAVEQVLIRRQIGGIWRSLAAGVIDAAVITFIVHELGSIATTLASFYFLACSLNAMVVGLRVGVVLAAVNAVAYAAVVLGEHLGFLAFAPAVPELAALGPPSFGQAITASTLIAFSLVTSTAVVGLLVNQLRGREAELMKANELLAELSQRDPLTNLFNRRQLFARLEHELERVRRGHALALLMLDLDGFKHVNDQQGHQRGDHLLREIAGALCATTRTVDVAGRYGGDEFVIILPDTDALQAQIVAERVAESVREVGSRFDAVQPVTASVGIASARADDIVTTLLRRADDNAYRAKQGGGDRVAA